jgi:hypothetical protein
MPDPAMAKTARRYDIYLPLTFNDGTPIPSEHFVQIETQLVEHFGGVTTLQRDFPLRGIWQGDMRLFYDQVIVMTALDCRPRGSSSFIGKLKRAILGQFDQLEILITEAALRIH